VDTKWSDSQGRVTVGCSWTCIDFLFFFMKMMYPRSSLRSCWVKAEIFSGNQLDMDQHAPLIFPPRNPLPCEIIKSCVLIYSVLEEWIGS
jgi:hypothetical protein